MPSPTPDEHPRVIALREAFCQVLLDAAERFASSGQPCARHVSDYVAAGVRVVRGQRYATMTELTRCGELADVLAMVDGVQVATDVVGMFGVMRQELAQAAGAMAACPEHGAAVREHLERNGYPQPESTPRPADFITFLRDLAEANARAMAAPRPDPSKPVS